MSLKIPAHLRPLARQARAQGWVITYTGSGHLRWQRPDGAAVITGSTPQRRGHADKNARRSLARAGLA